MIILHMFIEIIENIFIGVDGLHFADELVDIEDEIVLRLVFFYINISSLEKL